MRCREAKREHDRLLSIAGKLEEQDIWLTKRIGEVSEDVEHLDLMDKLINEQTASANRLQDVKSKLGQIERHYGFLRNEGLK